MKKNYTGPNMCATKRYLQFQSDHAASHFVQLSTLNTLEKYLLMTSCLQTCCLPYRLCCSGYRICPIIQSSQKTIISFQKLAEMFANEAKVKRLMLKSIVLGTYLADIRNI